MVRRIGIGELSYELAYHMKLSENTSFAMSENKT